VSDLDDRGQFDYAITLFSRPLAFSRGFPFLKQQDSPFFFWDFKQEHFFFSKLF